MKFKLNCGLAIAFCLAASIAWADSLELKNGSLIEGTFLGGTETEITFQVGSSVQKYNLADIVELKFDSQTAASDMPTRPVRTANALSVTNRGASHKTLMFATHSKWPCTPVT